MRIKNVEGIRGIAALIVLFNHLTVMYYPAAYWGGENISHISNNLDILIGQSPLSVIFSGNSAVMIFFILTGFGAYFVHEKGKSTIVSFSTLRFFKLTMPIVLSCFMVWLLFALNLTFYRNIIESTKTLWFGDWNPYNVNFFKVLLHIFTEARKYNNTLWTMPYIFKGSFLVILLKSIWGRSSKRHFIYIIAIALMINLQDIYYVPCILGLLLADWYSKGNCRQLSNFQAIVLLIISLYFFGVPTYMKPEFIMYRFLIFKGDLVVYYHIIGAFLLLYVTLYWHPLEKLMEKKLFQFLGNYSMAIYMVHYPILISISSWLFLRLSTRFKYNLAVIQTILVTIIIVMIIAILFQKVTGVLNKKIDLLYVKFFNSRLNR